MAPRIRDSKLRALIAARIDRAAHGNLGDAKQLGDGISEIRIHYGAGYRIYFHRRGDVVIVLLCAGDKSSQQRDIESARRLLAVWRHDDD